MQPVSVEHGAVQRPQSSPEATHGAAFAADSAAAEPQLAGAAGAATTNPLANRLGSEVQEGMRHLSGLSSARPREAAALDDMSQIADLVAQRQAEKDQLCASITDELGGVHTVLLETQQELENTQRLRQQERALAQQVQPQLAARERQVQEQAAEIERLRAALEAEQARRQAAESSNAQQQAVATGMGLKARQLEAQQQQAAAAQQQLVEAAGAAEARAKRAEELFARERERQQQLQQRATAELDALRQQCAAEGGARARLEKERAALAKQLADAQRLCAAAGEECARVRRRNDQLERQAAAEAELRRATGVDQVLDDLGQLETMMGRMPDGAPASGGSSSTLARPDG